MAAADLPDSNDKLRRVSGDVLLLRQLFELLSAVVTERDRLRIATEPYWLGPEKLCSVEKERSTSPIGSRETVAAM